MRLNPAAFNHFLDGIGQTYLWHKSFACPCINPRSMQPTPGCPRCGGVGYTYDEPEQARAGVASGSVQRKWAQMGRYEQGDMVLVVPGNSPMWGMGEYDRVTAMNASDRFSTRLTRGAANERLFFTPVTVERLFWLGAQKQIIDGPAPQWVAGVPSWPDGDGPPPGTVYSVTGTKRLEYFVFDTMPHNRNQHHGARLPQNIVLRKWDLLGRGINPS